MYAYTQNVQSIYMYIALLCVCVSQGLKLRAGIVGIERNIEKKQQQTGHQVSQAFKDLDALIDKARLLSLC